MDSTIYGYDNTNWHQVGEEQLYSNNNVGTVTEETSSVGIVPPVPPVSEVQVVVPEVAVSTNEFDRLEWSSCDYDGEGKPVGFEGKLWGQFAVVKL
jgi:hypothetical protein